MLDETGPRTSGNALVLSLVVALWLFEVLALSSSNGAMTWAARITFLVLCLFGGYFFSIRETALLFLATGLSLFVWKAQGSLNAVIPALDLAAFFGAFIAALTAMREVAARSRSILKVGRYLTTQPPGRRYYATSIGGHVLGVFLNFGAISLMAPLIQRNALDADGKPDPELERRQISALIRGFAWLLLWAPTTLTQAVLLTIFTDVGWWDFAPLGIVTALGFIVLGRLYDRFEWPTRNDVVPLDAPAVPTRAMINVAALCSVLIGATLVGSALSGGTIAQALLFVSPAITVFWYLLQPAGPGPGAWRKVAGISGMLKPSARDLARSAVALGLSGFIGRVAGQAVAPSGLSEFFDLASVPGWLFLAALPLIVTLGGQIALSPIMLVVFIGEVLRGVTDLPTGQAQIVFALCIGWSMSMTASPNATATILISSACRIPPTTLTWKWNLKYGLLCYAVSVLIFALIS